MNCKWCSLPFLPNEFRVDLRDDFYHADCWLKKLQSIGKNSGPAREIRRDGRYPDPRREGEDA